MVPTLVKNSSVQLFVNFFGNTVMMIMIEIQYRGGSNGFMKPPFSPLMDFKQAAKNLDKQKLHNKITLTFTSFCCKSFEAMSSCTDMQ